MRAVLERIDAEVKRLDAIEARRGILCEDERARNEALKDVLAWSEEEKLREKLAVEQAKIEQQEAEHEAYMNDPNRKTKDLFQPYKMKLQKEGRMR